MSLYSENERMMGDQRWLTVSRLAVACLILMIVLPLATYGDDAKSNDLAGTWNLTATFGGEEAHALVTFFKDGTFISTSASRFNVNAHGVWKRLGSRTFVEKNREFIYDESGNLAFFGDTTELIELSDDGMTFVGEAIGVLKLLDGTPVGEIPFTVYGTRMVLDL